MSNTNPPWSSTATMGSILFSCIILSMSAMIGAKGELPKAPSNTSPWSFTASVGSIFFSCIILSMAYYQLAPRYQAAKQLRWILTTITSAVMILASIPFLYDYFSNGGSVRYIRILPNLSVTACRFFQSFLAMDLALGAVYYRSAINFFGGWIHHPLYIVVVELFIRRSWAHIFCLCAAIMEVPDLLLGFMILHPDFRSDIIFAVVFFLTRVLFNIFLGVSYFLYDNRAKATGGSYIPSIVLAQAFPVHVIWFYNCIKGIYRRGSQRL